MWVTVIGAAVSPVPGKMTLRITSSLSLTLFRTERAVTLCSEVRSRP